MTEALIARQDGMSARVARSIEKLLSTHVNAEGANRVWRRLCARAAARLLRIAPDAASKIRSSHHEPSEVHHVLEALIHEALAELGTEFAAPDPQPVDLSDLPKDEVPRVRPSTSLPEARAQLATLQARLMDLRARIVPFEKSHLADLSVGAAREPHLRGSE